MNITDPSPLEKILTINFSDKGLLTEALTHRSYLNEHPTTPSSNERLEFLGDSVLSILVSTELYKLYPTYPEGKLTALRSSLVRAKTLAELADTLTLGDFLLLSRGEEKGGGRKNGAILADTFEAVLGAVYLDQGLAAAKKVLARYLFPRIEEQNNRLGSLDYKSSLQEFTQEQSHQSPTYKVLAESGPDHAKHFSVGVFLATTELARGEGKSKQEAEQDAARLALEKSGKLG